MCMNLLRWATPSSSHLELNLDGAFDPTSGSRGVVWVVARDADRGFVAAMEKLVGGSDVG
ncbi:unnamed protein product [Prunus armeniaca]|uniref:Uncharacterized protein n=1 Tax=Prunus armeniaca TaxID=36596 RepID=A0A6J5TVH9_PRUAR|nr:unnamed protein product [Prunus armeniaca]